MRTLAAILADMQALMDATAGRNLTAEEVTQYEALEAERAQVEASDAVRQRHGAYNVTVVPEGQPAPAGGPRKRDDYTVAFENYLRTGKPNADLERGPVNKQSEGVPSEGGYLVPDEFRTKLVERMKAFGGIGSVAERYTTGTGASVRWPTVDDTGNVGEVVEENGTFQAGSDVVIGSNSLGSYSYMAGGAGGLPLRLSRELVQDAAFDTEGLISRLLGTRIARLQAVHLATGTGVEQPLGLVTGRTPVQAAANTGATFDDLVTWIHSVDPAYRQGSRWVMNDNTLAMFEKIKDSHGDPIWRGWGTDMATGLQEGTLLGYPITIDQAMPDYDADDSTDLAIAFGRISEGYVVRDVKSVELLVNPYNRMQYREIEYTAWARMDATQQDLNAYIVASGKS